MAVGDALDEVAGVAVGDEVADSVRDDVGDEVEVVGSEVLAVTVAVAGSVGSKESVANDGFKVFFNSGLCWLAERESSSTAEGDSFFSALLGSLRREP